MWGGRPGTVGITVVGTVGVDGPAGLLSNSDTSLHVAGAHYPPAAVAMRSSAAFAMMTGAHSLAFETTTNWPTTVSSDVARSTSEQVHAVAFGVLTLSMTSARSLKRKVS